MEESAAPVLEFIELCNEYLWSEFTFYLLMGSGILFTILTRFSQYLALTHGVQVVRGVYDDPNDPGAINHFQALAAALSATVGLGNIGGVALAIAAGGPGALFWMWIIGALGMAIKIVEITLAMMYRNTDDPENPHGGAMWVIDKTLGSRGGGYLVAARVIGGFFCVTTLISTITGGNMFQSWNVAALTQENFGVPKEATGIILAIIVGLVIVGGIKRIGAVAGKLAPVMCLLYLAAAFLVLGRHIAEIPSTLALVVRSAFSESEAVGAFLGGTSGFAFSVGLRRALFSNEAGQGSAPIAHAAAKTNEPAREGLVGGIGPFIDTICICTLTALVILTTGAWNRSGIGEYSGSLELVLDKKKSTADKLIYTVRASEELDKLPETAGLDPWAARRRFFLLAQVPGSVHRTRGTSLVEIRGQIAEVGATPESPGSLVVEWRPLELKKDDWQGAEPTERWKGPADAIGLLDSTVYRAYDGASLTAHAFDRDFPGLGKWLVTIAAWLFALSTMISWSYYGEQGMIYLAGSRWVLPYKMVFLVAVVLAPVTVRTDEQLGALIDFGTGWMLWGNLPIVLGLAHLSARCLRDYERRLRNGAFHPHQAPKITDVVEGKDS